MKRTTLTLDFGPALLALGLAWTPASFGDAARTYENPLIPGNLADPAVILHEGTYYLYATGEVNGDNGTRVYTSTNLVNWQRGPVVFQPGEPHVWAPDVWRDPSSGRFALDPLRFDSAGALFSRATRGIAQPAPVTAAPKDFQSRAIFPAQQQHVHSSSIVELPNGDLFAVWFQGSGERTADDVGIRGARLPRGAQAWSEVFLTADTPNLPDCNPVVFLDGRQRLWLVWIVVQANRWEQSLLKCRVATDYLDDGPPRWQWQDVILLRPGPDFPERLRAGFRELDYRQRMWGEYARPYDELLVEAAADPVKRDIGWMTRTPPLLLTGGTHAGRLLLPLYSDGFNLSLMAISDDDGAHWRPSQPMVGLGNIQPALARRSNGTIMAFMRDVGLEPARVQVSESHDGGETWSVARDTDLPNPGSSLAVVDLADGRWLLVCNDTESGRHQLAVLVSQDEGRTWQRKQYLEKAAPGAAQYHYPTVIRTREGRVHVTYTHGTADGKRIQHAEFDPAWLDRD